MNDLKMAVRQLFKQPVFTVVAVLTLALGIGANALIVSMVDAFFFKPLPVKGAERLVFVLQKTDAVEFPHGYCWSDFRDLRRDVGAFEEALALMMSPAHLGAAGRIPDRTWVEFVSGNYFSMLGVPPALGQTWVSEGADTPGQEPVIVLSHQYWRRQFGADPSLVGRSIMMNGQPVTVIGVMPEDFSGAQWAIASSAWVPVGLLPQLQVGGEDLLNNRGAPAFKVMARLQPDQTAAQAQAAVDVALRQLVAEYHRDNKPSQVIVVPERRSRPEPSFSQFLPVAAVMFSGLVLMVLLIACANVANLMFSRAVMRQKEMGIRAAVGASRWRLVRQLLIESVFLALLACGVGTLLAQGLGLMISEWMPQGEIPARTDDSWSWRVLVITLFLSMGAGVMTGLVPALRATRLDMHAVLKEGGSALLGSSRHPFRSALVIGQTALCVAVLVCGGLFLESLRQLTRLDLGFRAENLMMASLDLGLQRYPEEKGQRFYRQLTERLEALPGAQAVAIAGHVPFDYNMRLTDVAAEGTTTQTPADEAFVSAGFCPVSTNYLRTLGITLVRGRDFDGRDGKDTPRVALVNETLARRLWGEEDPLGRRFWFGRGGYLCEVVGVVRNGKYLMLGEEPRPFVYKPLAQHYATPVTLHIRTDDLPLALAPGIRAILGELDPDLPIYGVRTMEEHLRQSALALMPLRIAVLLAGLQGLLGLCLAVMGVYGVVAYIVSGRNREIGIRMALGAQRWDVLRAVMREGWHLTLIGLAIGFGLALLLALGLSRLLYGLNPINLPVFVSVLLILGVAALLACYWPARRALRVDPVEALRSE